jgi:hypothetical protein
MDIDSTGEGKEIAQKVRATEKKCKANAPFESGAKH